MFKVAENHTVKSIIFWDVTQCSLAQVYECTVSIFRLEE
jgi:hypothetical protein